MTNDTHADRAIRALTDVVAVETVAPGLVNVVTWGDAYPVDARDAGCNCPDSQHNLPDGEWCKHRWGALLADAATDLPAPFVVTDSLDIRADRGAAGGTISDGGELVADGGEAGAWTIHDPERDNTRTFETRADAEAAKDDMAAMGVDVDLHPPGEGPQTATDDADDADDTPDTSTDAGTGGAGQTHGGPVDATVVEMDSADAQPVDVDDGPTPAEDARDLPERDVTDDPLTWVPGDFVDEIDGTQAINRKGFEVLAHFYDVDVSAELQVAPEDTDHEYAWVKATATTAEGRTCEAFGSAHVDRGDDPTLLLEMAGTRARKRALSIATGVGAVAVPELKAATEGSDAAE